MNKKRLIGYLLVIVSVGCIHAQEKSYLYPNTSYGMTVPRRYGPRHYPLEMVVWGPWYMEHQAQNKYN